MTLTYLELFAQQQVVIVITVYTYCSRSLRQALYSLCKHYLI